MFQKNRQEPPTSFPPQSTEDTAFSPTVAIIGRFNPSPTLYPETQAHPKAIKYSKTEEIFHCSSCNIWGYDLKKKKRKKPLHFSPSITTVSDC